MFKLNYMAEYNLLEKDVVCIYNNTRTNFGEGKSEAEDTGQRRYLSLVDST